MSNHRPTVGGNAAQEELRRQLQQDLETFLNAEIHISGYIVAWLARNLRVDQLERLVDELDGVYRYRGGSILGRRPSGAGQKGDRL